MNWNGGARARLRQEKKNPGGFVPNRNREFRPAAAGALRNLHGGGDGGDDGGRRLPYSSYDVASDPRYELVKSSSDKEVYRSLPLLDMAKNIFPNGDALALQLSFQIEIDKIVLETEVEVEVQIDETNESDKREESEIDEMEDTSESDKREETGETDEFVSLKETSVCSDNTSGKWIRMAKSESSQINTTMQTPMWIPTQQEEEPFTFRRPRRQNFFAEDVLPKDISAEAEEEMESSYFIAKD